MSATGSAGDARRELDDLTHKIAVLSSGNGKKVDRDDLIAAYLNRVRAYVTFARTCKETPASVSEAAPVFGLDPAHLGELGVRDLRRVLELDPSSGQAHALMGDCFVLMERYGEARECLLRGLAADPTNRQLNECLRIFDEQHSNLEHSMAGMSVGSPKAVEHQVRPKKGVVDGLECTLCLRLYLEPITTPCGHSFCRGCLARAMDHQNRCPVCRTVLLLNPQSHPCTVALQQLIQTYYQAELEERIAENRNELCLASSKLPLFVMSVIMPGQRMQLNIFEPRYRLMIRRSMEGNRLIGMAMTGSDGLVRYGCEARIIECEPQPDGRIHIEIVGKRRIYINSTTEQDGYRVADVSVLSDSPLDEDERKACRSVIEKLEQQIPSIIDQVRKSVSYNRQALYFRETLRRLESKPSLEDPEEYSLWAASILFLPPEKQVECLGATNTVWRLSMVENHMTSISSGHCRLL
eukprot:CAMPEP_0119140900 /NCGR_PEP_ID=MMETSP1310-20130426/30004_1 /TAXON_ID=464262 /ORGANISM="Genus nov. species nov., Strain RCC2339" /LENGTH=465 /DNA_ID=CAMNT_0007132295 /DNA_START=77 /DNA_END=1474 /DNA_ORIENTATION=+